jgi:uncharacterized protein (TIGR02453 family)
MTQPHFSGFSMAALGFLTDLAAKQNRDWFLAHKAVYDTECRGALIDLVLDLSAELARRKVPLQGDPKRSTMRINRDVRFSKDKSLYKTHLAATLTRSGAKMEPGMLYLHIHPTEAFAACGFYHAEPDELTAIRSAIARDPAGWRGLRDGLTRHGVALRPDPEALKRVPRGFETVAEVDIVDAVRMKSFVSVHPLDRAALGRPDLVTRIADFAVAALPLLQFGWAVQGRHE